MHNKFETRKNMLFTYPFLVCNLFYFIFSSLCEEEQIRKFYPIDCQFRGRCIFFGNGIFDNKGLTQRHIIEKEKTLIEATFTNLRFKTESYLDLKYCNIKRIIDKCKSF